MCFATSHAKHRFGYDDALDAFGIHGPGGVLGGILTGVFATEAITGEGSGIKGCLYGGVFILLIYISAYTLCSCIHLMYIYLP